MYKITQYQENLIYQHQTSLYPESLNLVYAFKIDASLGLSSEAAIIAWIKTVNSFTCLRTYFIEAETNNPRQLIYSSKELNKKVDEKNWEIITESLITNWLDELKKTKFVLNEPPLWRFSTLREKSGDMYCGIVFHHILADVVTIRSILESWCSFCDDKLLLECNENNQIKPLLDSTDFLLEESIKQFEQAEEYYKLYLHNKSLYQPLPWNCEGESIHAKRIYKKLSPHIQKMVQDTALSAISSPFLTFFALFSYLIIKWSCKDNLMVGYPIRARGIPSNGFYVNTFPLVINISDDETLLSLIEKIYTDHTQNKKYYTFHLRNLMNVTRATNNNQPFNVVFSSTDFFSNLKIKNLVLESIYIKNVYSQNDIIFYIDTRSDDWAICLEYKATILTDGIAESFLNDFLTTLEKAIPNKDMALNKVYNQLEERKLAINKTPNAINDIADSFIDIFKSKAIEHPNAIALKYKDSDISYIELYKKSYIISEILKIKGARAGDKILLHLQKSPFYIESLLAVLMCRCVLVPVDITQPKERLQKIFKDSEAKFVLVNENYDSSNFLEKNIFLYEEEILSMQKLVTEYTIEEKILFNDPAYIIYTSGSTGSPKGVCISHSSLANLALEQGNIIGINLLDHILLFASISFDASISEWSTTLAMGGTLVIPEVDKKVLLLELENIINDYKISIITLPPTVLATLDPDNLKSLKTVLSAGESMPEYVKKSWAAKVRLFNAYGPTESTVCATMAIVSSNSTLNKIGPPLPGLGVQITNTKSQELCSIGAVGEIVVFGKSIALYYTNNNPENDKFYTSIILGDYYRNYRTGDLGYCDENNNIYFIGRNDDQIKINAHRIELGEIKAALESYDKVLSAYVSVQEDEQKEIYAFIYCETDLNIQDLKLHVSHKLPSYMFPNHYIKCVQPFQLNNSGKVNKLILFKDLATQINVEDTDDDKISLPHDSITKRIFTIWEKILKKPPSSMEENFFDNGGDSLKATRLVMEVQKEFGIKFSPMKFLNNPTILHLRSFIGEANTSNAISPWMQDLKFSSLASYNYMARNIADRDIYLITGATGYVGRYYVKDLLEDPKTEVWCIVRAANDIDASRRIYETLDNIGLKQSSYTRLKIFAGDVSLPNLGVRADTYTLFLEQVTEIVHFASEVHHLFDYNKLRASNVLSTKSLLALMDGGCSKRLHYISALSAINTRELIVTEAFPDKEECQLAGGYNITKWVSEKILAHYHRHNYPVFIYRLPTIWGPYNQNEFTWKKDHQALFLATCIQMEMAPNWNKDIAIIPVDWVSQTLKNVINNTKIMPYDSAVLNLLPYKPIEWKDFVNHLNQKDRNIRIVPIETWKNTLLKYSHSSYLYPLMSLYISDDFYKDSRINIEVSTLESTLQKCGGIKDIEGYLERSINFITNSLNND